MQRNAPGKNMGNFRGSPAVHFWSTKIGPRSIFRAGARAIGLGPIFTKFFGYSYIYRLAYQRCSLGSAFGLTDDRLRMLRSRKGWGLDNMKSS